MGTSKEGGKKLSYSVNHFSRWDTKIHCSLGKDTSPKTGHPSQAPMSSEWCALPWEKSNSLQIKQKQDVAVPCGSTLRHSRKDIPLTQKKIKDKVPKKYHILSRVYKESKEDYFQIHSDA